MLWGFTSHEESDESGGVPLDENYSIDDLPRETLIKIIADCEKFQTENEADINQVPDVRCGTDSFGRNEYSGDECAGHDFWLTRNGHGTGFWDRDYDEAVRDRLTASCKKYGECWVYVGDGGQLYIS